jgi:hypothetical protein
MAVERTRVIYDELRAGLAGYGAPEQILAGGATAGSRDALSLLGTRRPDR